MPNVQRHGLFGQQMHWNGITAESVKYDHIKFLELPCRCFFLEGKAGGAQHNVNCGGQTPQEDRTSVLPPPPPTHLRRQLPTPAKRPPCAPARPPPRPHPHHRHPPSAP